MDFDIELLIRLHWRGLAFVSIPTKVRYPADGVSHYPVGGTTCCVMSMHLRLFLREYSRACHTGRRKMESRVTTRVVPRHWARAK